MQKHLGMEPDLDAFKLERLKNWKTIAPGQKLPKSVTLFPRIDPEKRQMAAQTDTDSDQSPIAIKPEISIEEFRKVDLRVATVLHAERLPRAKKLLKIEIDLGENRTIIAGIAESYEPEELVGKQIIVVANLKPAKIMGILSNGMLIAASEKGKTVVATLDRKITPGVPLN